MAYEVRLEMIAAPQRTAVVRRTAALQELPRVIPEACGLVWNALKRAGVKGGRLIALYLDTQLTVEIGAEVSGAFPDAGEVYGSQLPAGLVAVTTHLGPYPQLPRAHEAVRAWSAAHGHDLAGPCWELYAHWDPAWEQNPAAIRTEVYYLLAS